MENFEEQEAELQFKKEIQNVLSYFVKEGIAQEVSPGEFILTDEGKKIADAY